MSIAFQLPRSTRRKDYDAAAGQTVFGPADFLAFDASDIRVRLKPAGTDAFVTVVSGVTVSLTASPAGFPIATFAAGRNAGDKVRVEGARVHQRVTDVTRSGALQTALIERELDTQAAVLQEMRRDVDEALQPSLDLEEAVATSQQAAQLSTTAAGVADGARNEAVAAAALLATQALAAGVDLDTLVARGTYVVTDPAHAPLPGPGLRWVVEVVDDASAVPAGVSQMARLVGGGAQANSYQRRRPTGSAGWDAWRLASSDFDASAMTVVSSGSGGIARPLAIILRNLVSVEDFGAVPDGVTVANAAFANALAYARANNYKRILVPGSYKLTQAINCAGVHVEGFERTSSLLFDRNGVVTPDLVTFDARFAGTGQNSFGGLHNLTIWAINGTQKAQGIRGFGDVDDQPDNVVIEDVGLTADATSWYFNGIVFDGNARTSPQGIRRLFLNRVATFKTENNAVYVKNVQNAVLDNVNTNQPVNSSGVITTMPTSQGGAIFVDGGGAANLNSYGVMCRGMYLGGPIILYRCAEAEVTGVVAGYYFDATSDFVFGKLRNRQANAGGWTNNNFATTSNVQII